MAPSEAERQQPARHARGSRRQSRRRGGAQPHAARSACSGHGRGARATGACAGATGAASPRHDLDRGVLGAPARHRPAQRAEGDEADRRRQPDGDGAVGEDRDEREVRRHGEGDEDADDAAAHGARDRDRVADLADEVGEHDDREGRRRAEGMEHRPQDRGVERPPGQRAEQARVARADVPDRVAHGAAEHVGSRVQAGGAARLRPRPAGAQGHRAGDGERGGGARNRAERERPVRGGDPERDEAARDGDRAEEDRVEHDEEAQQRARGGAGAEAGLAQRPQRHRSAADARGRQQPGRGRAAERHLRALVEPEAPGRTAADHPEQGDVAGEGQQLEDRAADDPARVGVQGAAQRVREGVQRASRDDERGGGGGRHRGGDGGAASERAHVEGRDDDVGVGLAEGHGVVVARRLRAFRFASTSRRPERMPARGTAY